MEQEPLGSDGLQNPGLGGQARVPEHLPPPPGARDLSGGGRWKEDRTYLAQLGQLGLLCHQHPCQRNFSETPAAPSSHPEPPSSLPSEPPDT